MIDLINHSNKLGGFAVQTVNVTLFKSNDP